MIYKYRGEWAESARCNSEAVARDRSDGDAWWNLGIAATARGDWATARAAWAECGIDLPEGQGPIEANFGLTPIRLDPAGRAEVVWCDRIDPARAVVRNVPLPESGHRFGDLLLHDGAPTGARMLQGREVPVFDALERLQASDYDTYLLDLPGSSVEQRARLSDEAFESGLAAEDWSESIAYLCRQCSEGLPHRDHDRELTGGRPQLAVAAAARSRADVEALVSRWQQLVGHDGYVGIALAD